MQTPYRSPVSSSDTPRPIMSRRSVRTTCTPAASRRKAEEQIYARRASEDCILKLQKAGAVSVQKTKPIHMYPLNICGVGKCGLRALFNVSVLNVFVEIIGSNDWILSTKHAVLKTKQLFDEMKWKFKNGGCIFLLRGHHWVALTDDWYTDDGHRWEVLNYKIAFSILHEMEKELSSLEGSTVFLQKEANDSTFIQSRLIIKKPTPTKNHCEEQSSYPIILRNGVVPITRGEAINQCIKNYNVNIGNDCPISLKKCVEQMNASLRFRRPYIKLSRSAVLRRMHEVKQKQSQGNTFKLKYYMYFQFMNAGVHSLKRHHAESAKLRDHHPPSDIPFIIRELALLPEHRSAYVIKNLHCIPHGGELTCKKRICDEN